MGGFFYNGAPIENYIAMEKLAMIKEKVPEKAVTYPNYTYNGTALEFPSIGTATSGYFSYGNKIRAPKRGRMPSPALWTSLYNITIECNKSYSGKIIYEPQSNVRLQLYSNDTLVETKNLMPTDGPAPSKIICEMVGNGGAVWGGAMGHGYSPGYSGAYVCLEIDLEITGSNITFEVNQFSDVSLTYNNVTLAAGGASPSSIGSGQGSPGRPSITEGLDLAPAIKILTSSYGNAPATNQNENRCSLTINHEYFPVTKTVTYNPNNTPYTRYRSGGLTAIPYTNSDGAYGFMSYGKGADSDGTNSNVNQTKGCFRIIY